MSKLHETYLPRGVVKPIPLYILQSQNGDMVFDDAGGGSQRRRTPEFLLIGASKVAARGHIGVNTRLQDLRSKQQNSLSHWDDSNENRRSSLPIRRVGMRASLDTLPAELYSAILSQTPLLFLQHSTYSLIRAIPRSPVPRYHLFTFIRLASQRQILSFSKFLRNNPEIIGSVRGLSLESWTVDPEVAINLIDVLRHVQELWLCIGPNFTPERLEEIIRRPFDHLENLSLRFKP